jgi:HD-GYP domain-containing protein (c-di-GMP phosphodiesterase class II)
MSIRTRLIVIFTMIMAMNFAAVAYLGGVSEKMILEQVKKHVDALCNDYIREFMLFAESSSKTAKAIAYSVESLPEPDDRFIRDILRKNLETNDGICGSTVSLNPGIIGKGDYAPYFYNDRLKGRGLEYKSLATAEYDYKEQDWFKAPMKSGKGVWSAPYFDRGGGNTWMVTYSEPILRGGRPMGVATTDVSIDGIVNKLKDFKISDNSYAFIVAKNRTCIGYPDKNMCPPGTSLPESRSFMKNPDAEEVINLINRPGRALATLMDPFNGKESVFLTLPIQAADLKLVFAAPREELLGDMDGLEKMVGLIFFILAGLSLILLLMISTSVTRPIGRLVRQAGKYAGGNFRDRADENSGPHEIRILSKAFNTMGDAIHEMIQELKETQREIVFRLGKAAEHRDTDTGMHIHRMSRYCAVIARAHGMKEEEWEVLLHATPMHDVGKIGIPDSVLQKPGKLSSDEFDLMKRHTNIGESILTGGKSRLLQMAEIVAHYHHEKWDGTGYPEGLRGEDIPLSARIACVADVFDALTMKRPYKEPWTVEAALEEIEKKSGKDFDPAIVKSLKENMGEILRIKEELQERE